MKLIKGDTLVVKSLDRLSRNKEDAKKELQYFSGIGVRVKILDLPTTMADIAENQKWVLDMINNILITEIKKAVNTSGKDAQYDEKAKRLLGNKNIHIVLLP